MAYTITEKSFVNTSFAVVAVDDSTMVPAIVGTAGDGMPPTCDSYGRIGVVPVTPFGPVESLIAYDAQALLANDVIEAGPAQLYNFIATNPLAVQVYVQFYNQVAAPTSGVTLSKCYDVLVPARSTALVQMYPNFYDIGLVWGASTTPVTYTNPEDGSIEIRLTARYGV